MTAKLSTPAAVVEITAGLPGPRVGAFFDLDGTLVSGFTATAHAGDRIRRRQAGIGEHGHTVVLSSSALTIHAEPVARFLGITRVLCNHFELDLAGVLTGEITRPIVWGPKKAAAVQQFCAANSVVLQDSYFYADGDEDLALMSLVGHPRPVNPRSRLAAVSAERGWPVLRVATSASGRRRRSRLLAGLGGMTLREA